MARMLSLIVLALLPGRMLAQEITPKEIVERAITAHGGMERLGKARADWVRVKGVLWINAHQYAFTGESIVQLPGQFKSTTKIATEGGPQTVSQSYTNETARAFINGKAEAKIPMNTEAEIRAVMHLDRAIRLVPLITDKDFQLIALGEVKVEGRPALGVKVLAKGQRELRLFFDKEKGWLIKTEHALDNSTDKEVLQEEFYSDYQDYAGYKRPSRLTVHREGKKVLDADVVEVKYYEKIEDEVFTKP